MAVTAATRPPIGPRRGFTIIEVLVTIVLLCVVGVALASTMQYATRTLERSRDQLAAAAFLHATVERIRVISYDSVADGSRSAGRGNATWTVQDSSSFKQVLIVSRYGSPARGQIVDSVTLYRNR